VSLEHHSPRKSANATTIGDLSKEYFQLSSYLAAYDGKIAGSFSPATGMYSMPGCVTVLSRNTLTRRRVVGKHVELVVDGFLSVPENSARMPAMDSVWFVSY